MRHIASPRPSRLHTTPTTVLPSPQQGHSQTNHGSITRGTRSGSIQPYSSTKHPTVAPGPTVITTTRQGATHGTSAHDAISNNHVNDQHASGFIASRFSQGGLLSNSWRSPSISFTLGGYGDDGSGYITLGRHGRQSDLHGAISFDVGHNRHSRRTGHGHYYDHYRPYHHDAYYPVPYYGYSYASAYYPEPYVCKDYETEVVVYVERESSEPIVADVNPATPQDPAYVSDATASNKKAPTLTDPNDTTLVGRGNAAFLEGRYGDARLQYISAVLADERDGHAKFLYAVANFAHEDYAVAGIALRRALLTTPTLMDYPVDVRPLYPDEKVLLGQMNKLAQYVQARPNDDSTKLLLGYLLYAVGKPTAALTMLNPLAQAGKDDSLAVLLRDSVVRNGFGTP